MCKCVMADVRVNGACQFCGNKQCKGSVEACLKASNVDEIKIIPEGFVCMMTHGKYFAENGSNAMEPKQVTCYNVTKEQLMSLINGDNVIVIGNNIVIAMTTEAPKKEEKEPEEKKVEVAEPESKETKDVEITDSGAIIYHGPSLDETLCDDQLLSKENPETLAPETEGEKFLKSDDFKESLDEIVQGEREEQERRNQEFDRDQGIGPEVFALGSCPVKKCINNMSGKCAGPKWCYEYFRRKGIKSDSLEERRRSFKDIARYAYTAIKDKELEEKKFYNNDYEIIDTLTDNQINDLCSEMRKRSKDCNSIFEFFFYDGRSGYRWLLEELKKLLY